MAVTIIFDLFFDLETSLLLSVVISFDVLVELDDDTVLESSLDTLPAGDTDVMTPISLTLLVELPMLTMITNEQINEPFYQDRRIP